MTSRWRDTLCGSAIKAKAGDGENRHLVNQGPSEVLSCGGAFLSRPGNRGILKTALPLTVFLPTDQHHVLVNGSQSQEKWVRYGLDSAERMDEIDVIEEALGSMGAKLAK